MKAFLKSETTIFTMPNFSFIYLRDIWNKVPFRHHSVNDSWTWFRRVLELVENVHTWNFLVTKFCTLFLQHIIVRCWNFTLKKALQELMFATAVSADKWSGSDMVNKTNWIFSLPRGTSINSNKLRCCFTTVSVLPFLY